MQRRIRVVITEPEYRKGAAVFDAASDVAVLVVPPDEASVAAGIRAHRAWAAVLGVEHYGGELYDALPRGGVIARFGVGHDGISKPLAAAAGVLVVNTPGVLEHAVAEHTLALILAMVKGLPWFVVASRERRWQPLPTAEVRGRRLAVIGCGGIGRRVARAAGLGLGMSVVGVKRSLHDAEELKAVWGFAQVTDDFAEAVRDADVVSLHIPATPATAHFADAARLGMLRADAILVNTARGSLVDELALHDALVSGRLGGAALDVLEREPYVPQAPEKDLRGLPNVLITPHVGSATREACCRVAERVLHNLRTAQRGDLAAIDRVRADANKPRRDGQQ